MESVKKLNDLDFYPNSLPNPIPSMLFPPNTTYEETSSVGPDGKMCPANKYNANFALYLNLVRLAHIQ